ncbi:XAC2610-related protein [Chryseobacterium sp. GP-SGM7]|uniref:XAC2610-related protein n=1 Tax=Chryseobacterium sp. GP-SGM7 TaxID=3411323 RepID=UPI003B94BDA0
MNYGKPLLILVCFGMFCNAQNYFELPNVSKTYNVIANIESCGENICSGKTMIDLYDKATMKKYQTLSSADFYLDFDEIRKPILDSLKNSIIFDDFNFDGIEDVAVRNGRSNKNPLYEVYTYDSAKQFVLNDDFNALIRSNSGMFKTDSGHQRIITNQKNGCCLNLSSEYQFFPYKGLVKVLEFEEDTRDPKKVVTVKREFIDYKWFSKTTTYPRELYFKEK